MVNFIEDLASQNQASIQLSQSVFSLGNYLLLNKQLINSEFFTHTSKVGVVVLVVRPQGVIRACVSMFLNMLGIQIELYGHVLGPPRFLFNYEKIIFSCKIRPFFNSLIKKFVKGIKDRFKVHFWCGDARFHTQNVLFTSKASFHMFRAAKTSRKVLFS